MKTTLIAFRIGFAIAAVFFCGLGLYGLMTNNLDLAVFSPLVACICVFGMCHEPPRF